MQDALFETKIILLFQLRELGMFPFNVML